MPRGKRPSARRARPARERNPPATPVEHGAVLRLVREVADELDPGRTSAVLVAGSWLRGDAHVASDVDLWVIGRRGLRDTSLERSGRTFSIHYNTVAGERKAMRDPARLGGAVPGWRTARILRDPKGSAARLRSEALRFRWSSVRRARDRYLVDQLVGWSEEVMKLLRAMETEERATASVQRNVLANRMAFLEALRREHLWGTENGLWEWVGRHTGRAFRSAQEAALSTRDAGWRESCEGALRLYAVTARANRALLRGEKRRIVAEACRRAGYPVQSSRSR